MDFKVTIKINENQFTVLHKAHRSTAAILKLTNVYCESFNQTWMVFTQCRLRAIKRNIVTLNVNVVAAYQINKVYVYARVLKRENGYKPFMGKVNFDGCAWIKHRNNPVVNMVYDFFKTFSNLNHTCPYNGEMMIKDFYLRPELLQLPLPTGEYGITLTWILNDLRTLVTNFYFQWVEDLTTKH